MSSVLDDADFDLKAEEDTDYLEMFKDNSIYPLEFRISLIADSTRQFEAMNALAAGDTVRVNAILSEINPLKVKLPWWVFLSKNCMIINSHPFTTMAVADV
jgi:hypothetical protein